MTTRVNWFKRCYLTIKRNLDINGILGLGALVISIISLYFQFFNVNHEVLYSFLAPSMNNEKMQIPMIYKNTGNQNELILSANIEMEVIPGDTSENYFQRIGDENQKLFPVIVAPGEYKSINMIANYIDYFDGMLRYTPSGVKYQEMKNTTHLSVVLTTEFVSDNSIKKARRLIGHVSFKSDRTFDRFDYEAIKLVELKDLEDATMVGGTLVNNNVSFQVKLNDSLTTEQIAYFTLMSHTIKDSALKKEIVKLLYRNEQVYHKGSK